MDGRRELSGDDADYWYTKFEGSTAFTRLFETADIDVQPDAFDPRDVTTVNDVVIVRYYYSEQDGDYISIEGVYNASDETLLRAELDDGYIQAPMCGHGHTWEYKDGEISKGMWIS